MPLIDTHATALNRVAGRRAAAVARGPVAMTLLFSVAGFVFGVVVSFAFTAYSVVACIGGL